ncbi:hypothetical protein FBUS_09847 [Fasciolopsis buskii]|uniref:Uncharacterized protein n=1 Tax=Fasciolopsis buskii TaxID=27845 RepID=A0A8E0VMD2_9TREM|nr:hypothetical protein FBUS_09847 [Fasciolopsis buski]
MHVCTCEVVFRVLKEFVCICWRVRAVTPQLLHYLKLDRLGSSSPDFGSLYIFTCAASCPLPRTVTHGDGTISMVEYEREVLIRQMVP